MRFEVPILAGLLFLGTQLLVRAQTQGFEAALLSSGVEFGFRAWHRAAALLRRAG